MIQTQNSPAIKAKRAKRIESKRKHRNWKPEPNRRPPVRISPLYASMEDVLNESGYYDDGPNY